MLRFFLKFASKREYLESLQAGNLRMNHIKSFVDLEQSDGKQGRGDKLEQEVTNPAFCMAYIDSKDIELLEEGEDYYKCKIIFTKEQKKRFYEDFGAYVMVISAPYFLQKISEVFEEEGYMSIHQPVTYDDFKVYNPKRMMSFTNQTRDALFWKDHALKYQQEYRIVILNKEIEVPFTINIGSLIKYSMIVSTDQLFHFGLEITVKKGELI